MAIEPDNDEEREARIRKVLAQLKVVQAEVARLAAEGSERAAQAVKGHIEPPPRTQEPPERG